MEEVVFYCRTSTSDQEKQETIKTQLSKLQETYKGRNVIKEYCDSGFSGAYLQRPALDEMRADAKTGKFNVLALYSLDRLSRKTGHQLFLQDELKKAGVNIEILGEPFKDTPQGRFSNAVFSAVGELELETIRQRMVDGLHNRIDNGVLVGCPAPYGYTLIKRDRSKKTEARFEINKIEARTIKEIFKTFINKQGIRQTAIKITDMGIYKGKPIQPKHLADILRNEVYIGNFYYFRTKTTIVEENRKLKEIKRPRPRKEWKLIEVPAIIDKTTFDKTQEILAIRSKNYITKSKYNYLLSGLIRCLHCGAFFGGKKNSFSKGKNYFVYLCHNRRKPRLGKERCNTKAIGSLTIEGEVWDYIKSLIKKPAKVKEAIKVLQEQRESKKEENQGIYDSLMIEKAQLKIKKSKILDLYANNNFTSEELDNKVSEYNKIEEGLDREIEKVQKDLEAIDKTNEVENEIERLCLEYQKADLDNAPFEIKKLIVRKWIKEINITDERRIILKVRVPIFEKLPITALSKHYTQACPTPLNTTQIGIMLELKLEFEEVIKV